MSGTKPKEIVLSAVKVTQPIGDFYLSVMSSTELVRIAEADIRRMEQEQEKERPVEKYLGIQRPLNSGRVADIQKYVQTKDAAFPTSVILAIDQKCAEWDEHRQILRLKEHLTQSVAEGEEIRIGKIASILDGQHRVKGLEEYKGPAFDVPVSIFIGADIATQANIFATVNLAQTKVNKSLVYDLFELANSRSPQKAGHNIAIILDSEPDSPFYKRIKRLGVATDGRFNETITQATFVEALLKFISKNPSEDRDAMLRGKKLEWPTELERQKLIFRTLFIEDNEEAIALNIWNYFDAAKLRWPGAWANHDKGNIFNKTNGFKAFFRFIRPVFNGLNKSAGEILSKDEVLALFKKIELKDKDFSSENFLPGTSGESALFNKLCMDTGFSNLS